jgi:hypothetical protein
MRTSLLHTLKRSWRALAMAALVPLIALTGCKEQSKARRVLTEADIPPPPKDAKYFRFKVDLLYRGEPLTYDIHGACEAFGISEVDPTLILSTGLTPYVYGQKMKDGQGVLVRVPEAICLTIDTLKNWHYRELNGVWREWFPEMIVYPDADRPTEGWSYATEDAYNSPLSDLKFVASLIEASTLEKFMEWRRTEGPKNFVKERMVDIHGGAADDANMRIVGPDTIRFGYMCYSMIRIPVPEDVKERVRVLWPADKPQIWVLPKRTGPQAGNYGEDVSWKLYNNIIFSRINGHLVSDLNYSPLRAGGGGMPRSDLRDRTHSHAVETYPYITSRGFNEMIRYEKQGLLRVMWARREDGEYVWGPYSGRMDGGYYVNWLAPVPPPRNLLFQPVRQGFAHCSHNPEDRLTNLFDRAPYKERWGVTVNDTAPPVAADPNAIPELELIFERDEFVFVFANHARPYLRTINGGLK